jgi:amidohydrolase
MIDMSDTPELVEVLLSQSEDLVDEIVSWRREFHQFPELGFEENITSAKVVSALEAIDSVEVIKGFGIPTSVIGVLGGELGGPALVIRVNMDAVPIQEKTGYPFSSCFPGMMHACGHDSHMAALLGAARILSMHKEKLKRPVVFLFQPAEEGKGGAKKIIEEGFLNKFKVGKMLGFHFWPKIPYGEFRTKKGLFTALSDRIHIAVRGVATHASSPHLGVDPLIVAANIMLAVQGILTRELDPTKTAVITFGHMEAGEIYNIVPESAHLWGTLRTFSEDVRDFIKDRLETMVPLIAQAHRAVASVEYVKNYPSLINDPLLTEEVVSLARSFFGEEQVSNMDGPILNGEDFAFYSLKVPSCFMLLGTGLDVGLHSAKYDVPEDLIPMGAAWLAYLGLKA